MMKLSITKKIAMALTLLSFTALPGEADAQCLTGDLYPFGIITPACNGTPLEIADDAYAGEYSRVAVVSGTQYTFSSSVATDYITISNTSGSTAYSSGVTPLVWTATVTGTVRFYTHTDAACGTSATDRSRIVECGTFVPAPANDECAGAVNLGVNNNVSCALTTPGSISGSTPSLDNMSCYTPGDFNDVWYKFTATATSHDIMVSGIPQGNLAVVVYSGACGAQTELYCGPVNAAVSGLAIGTEYSVRILSDLFSGSFNICVNTTPAPPSGCATNIAPANNAVLPLNPGTDFSWTAVPGATGYYFYIGETVATAVQLMSTATNSANVIGFTPGTSYIWYVVPFNTGDSTTGCYANTSSFTTAATVPNDECATALQISASSGLISGSTNGATQSMVPGTCETYTSSSAIDVWYSVTADNTGNIVVTTNQNVYGDDLVWEAYSGTCSSLSAAIGCSDEESNFTIAATAGQTYYIRVYGYGTPAAVFAMQVSGTALPVTMDKLKGQLGKANLAQLSWKTLSEKNNKGFEIQRSVDGNTFRTVGFVGSQAASGNSTEAIAYDFTDAEAVNGTVYYRLQQTDIDGKTALSNTVRLSAKENGAFEIVAVPNPVKDKLNIKTYGVRGDNAQVLITDLSGKVVRRININADDASVDMSSVANGIYLLKYTDATRTQTIKVSKQ